MITLLALYKFVSIRNPEECTVMLKTWCESHHIKGTLLVASEGINGTIASENENITAFLDLLLGDIRFQDAEIKKSYAATMPFHRMKVRTKKEIVTMNVPDIDPLISRGTYIDAADWNQVLNDPETLVIDTRNDYEVAIGTFEGAVNPQTKNFSEFPQFVAEHLDPVKHKKVAMFCTGGIRCEKSTAYLKKQGFDNVVHLKGGILKYLENISPQESKWQGECFVFDDRTAVTHQLQPSNYVFCRSCRKALSEHDKSHEHYLDGVHCAYCYPTLSEQKKASASQRQHQMTLAQKRGTPHLGQKVNHKPRCNDLAQQ